MSTRPQPAPGDSPHSDADAIKRENFVVAAIIAGHLAIALPLGLTLNIWIDESYTLVTTSKGLQFVFEHCKDFQLHPPFYYVLVWFWRLLGDSIPFLRIQPAIISAASIWFIHLAARRWFPRLPTPWIVLPLAVNPWMIYAATEIRPYCLVPFWSGVLLYLFYGGFMSESPRRIEQVLYMIAATLSMYTFYYLGFLLPGGALALLVWRRWRSLRDYVLLMIVAGLLVLPQVLLSARDSSMYTQGVDEFPTLLRSVEFVTSRSFAMISGLFSIPESARVPLLVAALVGVTVALYISHARRWDARNTAVPIVAATVTLIYCVLVKFVVGENMFFRHFFSALVPLHLSVAAIAASAPIRRRLAILKSLMIALTVLCVVASCFNFWPLAKVGDYRRVAKFLEASEKAGETIVIAVSHTEYPLRHYYGGVNEILPVPAHDDLSKYDPARWILRDRQQVLDALAGVKSGDVIWMYTDRPPEDTFLGRPLNLQLLEEVLSDEFSLESGQDFYHGTVRKFRRT